MTKKAFELRVKGGDIKSPGLREYIRGLEDGKYLITVEKYGGMKTIRQLGFFFAGIVETYANLYNEAVPADMYITVPQAAFRLKAISPVMQEYFEAVNDETGEIETVCRLRSKAELTKSEMMQHIDDCIHYIWHKYNYNIEPIHRGAVSKEMGV